MSRVKALVSITVPGTVESVRNSELVKNLIEFLDANQVEHHFVDNVLGWGCLNQDWLEFRTDIETSWGWCDIFPGHPNADFKEAILSAFHHGRLLMMISYVKPDGSLVSHG